MDFEEAVSSAKEGDIVYFDPPYTVHHGSNGFVKYNERIFSWKDQERLAKVAHRLAAQGVSVIVSNADHGSLRSLYHTFESLEVWRTSQIAAKGLFRQPVTERLFVARGK
jgi:DNA adenine methylase